MKIYVGNLPFSIRSDNLKELFSKFGNVTDAVVISDKFTRRSKGFGFVEFDSDDAGQKAITEMNGKAIEGRELKVNEAKPMRE